MKKHNTLKFLGALACFSLAASIANSQNIVTDPSFQGQPDPNFANSPGNWNLTEQQNPPPPGSGNISYVGDNAMFAHNGAPGNNKYAALADDTGQTGSLLQALATFPATFYTLSFWLAFDFDPTSVPPVPPGSNLFQARFNNSLVFTQTSPPHPQDPSGVGNYVQYTIFNLLSTGASTNLEFLFRQDTDYWRLDDVSVTAQRGFVPEGGAGLGLTVAVIAGLFLFRHRLHRTTKASRA